MKVLCILIITLFFSVPGFGQSNFQKDTLSNESLAEKFDLYSKSHSSTLLFLHTDKTLYINNETIWFSAYLISKENESLNTHNVLSVILVREDGRQICLESKYAFESGAAAGSLLLPDTITTGFYQLLAYTNIVDKDSKPLSIFSLPLTIRSLKEHTLITDSILSHSTNKTNTASPKIVSNSDDKSIILRMNNTVINDTLRFSLSALQNKQVRILVHNYRQAYAYFTVNAEPKEQQITVAVNKLPKGIATINILDNSGALLAERQFYAHYDNKLTVNIQTDKKEYAAKEKVTVKINITDKNGAPVRGLASISCVQSNRIQAGAKQNIESYVYLNNEPGHLPNKTEDYNNTAYLENVLLTKGWSKYNWQDLLNSSPADTLREDHSLVFTGSVTKSGRQLNKAVTLTAISDSSLKIINTDDSGRFTFNNEDLVVNYGRKVWMILNEKNKGAYAIDINDPYITINQKLAAETVFANRIYNETLQTMASEIVPAFESGTTLTNLIIKSKTNDHPFFEPKAAHGFNINACGDYVCAMYGDLNCPLQFHDLNNTLVPIKGKIYHKLVFNTQGRLVSWHRETYLGCSLEENTQTRVTYLPGIYNPQAFFGADYSQPDSPQNQYLSTLFWNPAILINNGETTFSFTTSDIKGKFNIVVQGVSTDDVLFGETSITVK